jgi:hypothetical protein
VTSFTTLLTPPTDTSADALEVVRAWSSPALTNHCLRSWVWAATLAEAERVEYDPELLFVAAMLHDLGVTPHFDAHVVPFEESGGAVAWVFGAGAGWSGARRQRVREVIERHMQPSVDPALDPEGYLLKVATTLDVRRAGASRWDAGLLRDVTAELPRLDFSSGFEASIAAEAARKPASQAARLHGGGGVALGARFWAEL